MQILKCATDLPSSPSNKPSTAPTPAPVPTPSLRVKVPSPTLRHKPTTESAPTPSTKHTPNPASTPTPAPEPRIQVLPPALAPRVQNKSLEDTYQAHSKPDDPYNIPQ